MSETSDRAAGGPQQVVVQSVTPERDAAIERIIGKDWPGSSAAAIGLGFDSGQRTAAARVQELEGMVSALRGATEFILQVAYGYFQRDHQKQVSFLCGVLRDTAAAAKEHDSRIAREARRDGFKEALERCAVMADDGDSTKENHREWDFEDDFGNWNVSGIELAAAIRSLSLPAETHPMTGDTPKGADDGK